jgi:hypothetical protein
LVEKVREGDNGRLHVNVVLGACLFLQPREDIDKRILHIIQRELS